MKRRTSIKRLLIFATLGVSSVPIYRWVNSHRIYSPCDFYNKRLILAHLAEVIIPRTDTPGAKDAKVGDFIARVMAYCADQNKQHRFIQGLTKLEKYTIEKYDTTFENCTSSEQKTIVEHFERESVYQYHILNKINDRLFGKSFFSQLKGLTVEGYCSSMVGATEGLAYDYIPGTYMGCISMNLNQKSWATK